jgi:hypothetical protein
VFEFLPIRSDLAAKPARPASGAFLLLEGGEQFECSRRASEVIVEIDGQMFECHRFAPQLGLAI